MFGTPFRYEKTGITLDGYFKCLRKNVYNFELDFGIKDIYRYKGAIIFILCATFSRNGTCIYSKKKIKKIIWEDKTPKIDAIMTLASIPSNGLTPVTHSMEPIYLDFESLECIVEAPSPQNTDFHMTLEEIGIELIQNKKILKKKEYDTTIHVKCVSSPIRCVTPKVGNLFERITKGKFCKVCHRTKKLKKCKKCKIVRYCSESCQKSDYEFHKEICKFFNNDMSGGLKNDMDLRRGLMDLVNKVNNKVVNNKVVDKAREYDPGRAKK